MILKESDFSIWLTYPHSITEKLKMFCSNVHLKLLNEAWGETEHWERDRAQYQGKNIFRREILMLGDNVPCWYARTLIPHKTYFEVEPLFKRLQKENLGQIIWTNPNIKRHCLTPLRLSSHDSEYKIIENLKLIDNKTPFLYGRISTFSIYEQLYFYLLEVFLPGLLKYHA